MVKEGDVIYDTKYNEIISIVKITANEIKYNDGTFDYARRYEKVFERDYIKLPKIFKILINEKV